MKIQDRKAQNGFSIVETIIVLTIAGLIVAVVFAAVPALQRNSRDTTRKNIVLRIKSEIGNYAANRSGTLPFTNVPGTVGSDGDWANFHSVSLSKININDPSLQTPVINAAPASSPTTSGSYIAAYPASGSVTYPPSKGILAIITGASCNGSSVVQDTGANSYALVIGLDKNGVRFCSDNN